MLLRPLLRRSPSLCTCLRPISQLKTTRSQSTSNKQQSNGLSLKDLFDTAGAKDTASPPANQSETELFDPFHGRKPPARDLDLIGLVDDVVANPTAAAATVAPKKQKLPRHNIPKPVLTLRSLLASDLAWSPKKIRHAWNQCVSTQTLFHLSDSEINKVIRGMATGRLTSGGWSGWRNLPYDGLKTLLVEAQAGGYVVGEFALAQLVFAAACAGNVTEMEIIVQLFHRMEKSSRGDFRKKQSIVEPHFIPNMRCVARAASGDISATEELLNVIPDDMVLPTVYWALIKGSVMNKDVGGSVKYYEAFMSKFFFTDNLRQRRSVRMFALDATERLLDLLATQPVSTLPDFQSRVQYIHRLNLLDSTAKGTIIQAYVRWNQPSLAKKVWKTLDVRKEHGVKVTRAGLMLAAVLPDSAMAWRVHDVLYKVRMQGLTLSECRLVCQAHYKRPGAIMSKKHDVSSASSGPSRLTEEDGLSSTPTTTVTTSEPSIPSDIPSPSLSTQNSTQTDPPTLPSSSPDTTTPPQVQPIHTNTIFKGQTDGGYLRPNTQRLRVLIRGFSSLGDILTTERILQFAISQGWCERDMVGRVLSMYARAPDSLFGQPPKRWVYEPWTNEEELNEEGKNRHDTPIWNDRALTHSETIEALNRLFKLYLNLPPSPKFPPRYLIEELLVTSIKAENKPATRKTLQWLRMNLTLIRREGSEQRVFAEDLVEGNWRVDVGRVEAQVEGVTEPKQMALRALVLQSLRDLFFEHATGDGATMDEQQPSAQAQQTVES
ncbi:hypothetical protein DFS34DRAFT_376568 [Phlyctochytrium arcticum]|nr:hypothetical protein DFS34DRAFT_376568 [Phlyctochytrium arcticum]